MITVDDMMSHISIQINQPLSGWLEGKVRNAVLAAWARLMTLHEWAYFHRMGSLITYAGQTTGEVDFTLSTRRVTLTGATWPANATSRHIRIDHNWYPVYQRISDTVIELFEGKHPAANMSDQAYVLQQVVYPLPQDVGDILQVIESKQNMQLVRLDIVESFELQEGFAWSPILPTKYALVGDSNNPQRWNLWIPTQQTQDTVLQYMYKARRPNDVLVREARGTVSVASGVATFSEDVVTTLWDGANVLLRISNNDTTTPTGAWGDTQAGDIRFDRNCNEVRVLQRLTSNTCRISNSTLSLTDVSYSASSLIDTGDATMEILVARLAEDEYGAKPVGNHNELLVSKTRLASAFLEAKSADGRRVRSKSALARWYGMRLQDIGHPATNS
jgi:hypothetical protein